MGRITEFVHSNFKNFNSRATVAAAKSYNRHISGNGKMLISLAGALSTAEIGISLAEMIRQDKVHLISCTGANIEEDLLGALARDQYKTVENYRSLSAQDDLNFFNEGFNRITDTCIPESGAFDALENLLERQWRQTQENDERAFPHEFFYAVIKELIANEKNLDRFKNSWLVAAYQKNLPILVPGWEDSSMGNYFASLCIKRELSAAIVKSGVEAMVQFVDIYKNISRSHDMGFFQIGGGIAGDFPICVVPLINSYFENDNVPLWSYFCQISDSTTSYGSYSGAIPNEKISWGKLDLESAKFIIESDASIVAPLIFAQVLGW